MSDCLHCDINELVAKHADRPDSDVSELVARIAESLADLILMAPETDRAVLLADAIAMLGQMYLEKSGAVDAGESTARH
jgi:predicted house-cleaning NTP pyrophosphatase (Maf/HAM1 superfamily)